MSSSKFVKSIMIAANALDEAIPPYGLFKTEIFGNLVVCRPNRTRYNRSNNDKFDMTSFQDWFFTFALLHCKKVSGSKSLLGINFPIMLQIIFWKHLKIKT